jgi:hypothetical protein
MNNWIRIFIGIVILFHGAGHVLFLVPALGGVSWGQSTRSWLLTSLLGDGAAHALGAVIWLAVIAGYLAGLVGYFARWDWWPPLLVGASMLSALGLLVYWSGTSPVISALLFDLVVVIALQVFKWPPAAS